MMDVPTSVSPRSTSQALDGRLISPHHPVPKHPTDLPPEIMTSILFFAVEPFIFEHFQRHQTLASVCRQWRDIIIRTPQFWVYIMHSMGLSRSLKLSRTSPLYVEPVDSNDETRVWLTDDELQAILECRDRWKRLRIELLSSLQADRMRDAFQHDLLLLEDVYLYDKSRSLFRSPLIIENAPRIRSLSTISLLPIIKCSSLSLHTLKIGCPPMRLLTIPVLHDLLAACPNLQSFEVRDPDSRGDPPNDQPTETRNLPSTISLPKLEELSIGDLPPPLALSFLRDLHTPSLTMFAFRWYPGVHIDQNTLRKDDIISRFFATMIKNKPPKLISLQIDNKNICVELDDQLVLHVRDRVPSSAPRAPRTELLHDIIDIFDMGKYPVELLWRVRNNAMPLVRELATLPEDTARIITLTPVLRKWAHFDLFFKFFSSLRNSAEQKPIFPAAKRMDIEIQLWRDTEPRFEGRVRRMLQHFNRPTSNPLNVYLGETEVFDETKGKFVPVQAAESGAIEPSDGARFTRFMYLRHGSGSTSSMSPSGEDPDFLNDSESDSDDAEAPQEVYNTDDYYNSDAGL